MRVIARFDNKKIQQLNMFEKVNGVKAKNCFVYNNTLVFLVSKNSVSKAIGKNVKNVKILASKLGKSIKIVAEPTGIEDVEEFIRSLVFPLVVKSVKLKGNEIVIEANKKVRALLLGKGKRKLKQLNEILSQLFGIKKVVVK